jgi:hypothetical protein
MLIIAAIPSGHSSGAREVSVPDIGEDLLWLRVGLVLSVCA